MSNTLMIGGAQPRPLNSPICALGYVGAMAPAVSGWNDYACNFLGMQLSQAGAGQARFRIDERAWRLAVHERRDQLGFSSDPGADKPGRAISIAYFGWEVADAQALTQLAARLDAAGVSYEQGSRALAQTREVTDLIVFEDPLGHRLEAFYGAAHADAPLAPGRNVSGFRAGALGMGHAVLNVRSAEALLPFYSQVLGFGLSDYITAPFKAYFLHVNGRHHSLALIEGPQHQVHHLMFEMTALDDVGQCYDLALGEDDRIGTTLGRHTNDYMTSFYARSPSVLLVVVGWGGLVIDPPNWQAIEMSAGPSLWGHDRTWMPAEGRAQARAMRLKAAADGLRAPVQVLPGQFNESR